MLFERITMRIPLKFILLFCIFFITPLANALVINSVSVTHELTPGETSRVIIALENDGSADVEGVSVSLDFTNTPFAPFDSSSEYSIDEIREDKTKEASFEIIALSDAQSGVYKIPVAISYRDLADDTTKTKNSLISIVVVAQPVVSVSVDGWYLKGQNNEIVIRVTNKGLSDAKFLEVDITNTEFFTILSPSTYYIGDVDSDDFDSIDVSLYVAKNAPDNGVLAVRISYRDNLNNLYTEEKIVTVRSYTQSRAVELGLTQQNNMVTYGIGIVLIIVLFFVYRWLKRRARARKVHETK